MTPVSDPATHPFLRGIKAGGHDDAIHLVAHKGQARTLCGLHVPSRNVVLLSDPRPDSWAGCWTCLDEAEA